MIQRVVKSFGGWRLLATAGALLVASAGGAALGAELDCLIEPKVVARISTPVPGVLEKITVERGDLVEVDKMLARLESSVEEAAVAVAQARALAVADVRTAEARLELRQSELDRTQTLHVQQIASSQEIQVAETNKRVAEMELLAATETRDLARLDLARAAASLKRRTLRSPIRGVVVEVLGSPGEFFDEQPIIELAQLDPLRIEVFAPIAMLGSIKVGTSGVVRPEAPVGGEYHAAVTVVDRVVDAASGTFGVRLEIPNPDYALSAGLNCTTSFTGSAPSPVAAGPDDIPENDIQLEP